MKKKIGIILILLLMIAFGINLTACNSMRQFSISYSAETGGSISGKTSQTIAYGKDADKVTAEPDEGYTFIRWSDGNTNAERTDRNVTSPLNFNAEFDVTRISYKYNYNEATAN